MEHALIIVVTIIIIGLIAFAPLHERFSQSLRFSSISSGGPVPYGISAIPTTNEYHIRRWRTAIPPDKPFILGAPNWANSDSGLAAQVPKQVIVPRSIQDDEWARTYDPGIGFQLG